MDAARRNEIGYLLFKKDLAKKGLNLNGEPIDFKKAAEDVGGSVTPEEMKDFMWGIILEMVQKTLGNA